MSCTFYAAKKHTILYKWGYVKGNNLDNKDLKIIHCLFNGWLSLEIVQREMGAVKETIKITRLIQFTNNIQQNRLYKGWLCLEALLSHVNLLFITCFACLFFPSQFFFQSFNIDLFCLPENKWWLPEDILFYMKLRRPKCIFYHQK